MAMNMTASTKTHVRPSPSRHKAGGEWAKVRVEARAMEETDVAAVSKTPIEIVRSSTTAIVPCGPAASATRATRAGHVRQHPVARPQLGLTTRTASRVPAAVHGTMSRRQVRGQRRTRDLL
ncbi:hypothetical protein PR202_gb23608 [Eleusine coracana subsp. coracana]|uniref:Uncharacterized protein n=1 Tax=Eleusine coracana subsp. coracana TaxID=191504 RepID=A0AAV5FJV9_ELECO|nr:hypothetical protein PR202_gb23608 [Eleusine coracana subsp. coracana]